MGTTVMRKPDDVAGWIRTSLAHAGDVSVNECLDVAIVGWKSAYAAVRTTYADGTYETWAAVYALQFLHEGRGDERVALLAYKPMTENAGPVQTDCPKRILDLLTPTDSADANGWREKCRQRIERRATTLLQPGDRIRFRHPLLAGDRRCDTFRYVPTGRRERFMAIDVKTGLDVGLFRIVNWKEREFVRLQAPEGPGPDEPARP